MAARLAAEEPTRVTDSSRRAGRAGRVFVDWLGNEASRTIVAPYSLRAADFPMVSTPLQWRELEVATSARELWLLAPEVLERVSRSGDPLAGALELRQRLPE